MKKLVMAVVPLLAFGCGPDDADGDGIADGIRDPNNVTVVVPATPKGTVSGQLLTTQQKPLSGANVTLTIGSEIATKTAQTDADGNFAFKDVPGGAQVLLTFTKDGFAPLRATSIVPNSAGTVPINDGNASFGPVILSELNGTVKVNVIGPDGRPAAGVQGTLEVDPAGVVLFGASEKTTSKVVVEATADASGVLTFERVPRPIELNRLNNGFGSSPQYLLSVSALDANNDGVFEAGGLVTGYTADQLIAEGTVKTEALPYAYNPGVSLAINHSTLAALKDGSNRPQFNMVKPGEDIYIVFNQPVQPNSVIVGLTDEYGKESLSINKSVTNGGTVLTLTPVQPVQAGREYNLYVRAVSINGSATGATPLSRTIAFFGGDLAQPQNIAIENLRFQDIAPVAGSTAYVNGRLDNGETVYINFNQVMNRYGARPAYVLFNVDLDGNGSVGGNSYGEVGNKDGMGFPLYADEPVAPIQTKTPAELPVFTLTPSTFTTRYAFSYSGRPLDPASVSGGLQVVVSFSGIRDHALSGYANAWGITQTADLSGAIFNTGSIPPPTP